MVWTVTFQSYDAWHIYMLFNAKCQDLRAWNNLNGYLRYETIIFENVSSKAKEFFYFIEKLIIL